MRSNGKVSHIGDDVGTPFAVVSHFIVDQDHTIEDASSFEELTDLCDRYRDSGNLFSPSASMATSNACTPAP